MLFLKFLHSKILKILVINLINRYKIQSAKPYTFLEIETQRKLSLIAFFRLNWLMYKKYGVQPKTYKDFVEISTWMFLTTWPTLTLHNDLNVPFLQLAKTKYRKLHTALSNLIALIISFRLSPLHCHSRQSSTLTEVPMRIEDHYHQHPVEKPTPE